MDMPSWELVRCSGGVHSRCALRLITSERGVLVLRQLFKSGFDSSDSVGDVTSVVEQRVRRSVGDVSLGRLVGCECAGVPRLHS